jgi:hypothetical protein
MAPLNANNKTGYRGVSWDNDRNKYRAQIKVNGWKVYLGLYDHPVVAAFAYDDAARRFQGDDAKTNF